MRITRSLLLCLFVLAPVPSRAVERWYVFSLAETPVGYAVEEVDAVRTRHEVFARLTRLGKSVEMRFETTAVESDAGELQALTFQSVLSKQATRLEAHVEGDKIVIRTGPHERTIERGAIPILGPRAIARISAAKLRTAGDAVEYSLFSPELQRVARAKRSVVALADAACDGSTATRVDEVIEGYPVTRTLWMDSDGAVVGDVIPGPFGPLRTCRSTRDIARAADGTLPADLYERTLARSNVRFADPFSIDRIVLRVARRDSAQTLPSLVTHNQRVLAHSADAVTVEVGRVGGAATTADEFLKPNALIQSDDEAIIKLAAELTRATPAETAAELTRWVAENLTMDAGIVMAPASELIRDRRATCMGYATLLAALDRAAGIPTRIVMGYVYYSGIWGGHAWTEMILDGRWVPLDAAVYTRGSASAARLAAGASSFADGGGGLQAALSPLLGRVDIDVVEYEERGRTTRVAADVTPFRLEKGAYVNPGLGLRIASNGWTIERADSVWPSSVVVAFRRGENVVELHHRPAQPEQALEREGDAMYIDRKGGMIWIWAARGPDAAGALRQFLR